MTTTDLRTLAWLLLPENLTKFTIISKNKREHKYSLWDLAALVTSRHLSLVAQNATFLNSEERT